MAKPTKVARKQALLEAEIAEKSKEISTDAYAMSVGEMISLYRDGELDIHPEFQRFFRWTLRQKSNLIESLLLGIPIPSMFVSQKPTGAWDVIDGVQRLSTILQLTGDLKDENEAQVEPLVLERTRYLPQLEGMRWTSDSDSKDSSADELPQSAKLRIKRSRLDLKIVLNTSDPSAKFELFQRLNTGGSGATDQEIRNCLLIMVNRRFWEWFRTLAENENFASTVPLSERALGERFDLDLATRFLTLRTASPKAVVGDLGAFLTERVLEMAQGQSLDLDLEKAAFDRTFDLLSGALGEDAFKKFDPKKDRPLGPVLVSVFEVMALGMGYHAGRASFQPSKEKIKKIHKSLWSNKEFLSATGSGVRAKDRIPVTLKLGRQLFKP